MFVMSGMIPKVQYTSNFRDSFAENFLQIEQKIVDLKRVVKNKKNSVMAESSCLLLCFFRFLQVTCVDVLWSLTSSRKLEISVELRKEGV